MNGDVVVPYGLEYHDGAFDLPAGANTLAIEVTAEDGTTQTYTFTVERQGGDAPAAPSRPTIQSVSHDSVTIAWNDPGDSTITGYQVLRRNPAIHDTGVFAVIEDDTGSSDTNYEDTTVAPETEYVYRVRARNAHGLSEESDYRTVTTPAEPTPPNQAATGVPTIAGTPQVGETLSADTSGISDANGLTNAQYAYQWIRNDGNTDESIPGATGQTHTLTPDDQGNTIKVQVSFTDDHGYPESLTSTATAAVGASPVDPVDPVDPVEPVEPVEPVDTLWSGEMTVADYGNASLGAYNDDTLFSNVTSSIQLQVKWLWYLGPARKLYLAFRAPVAGTADWTLHIDEQALEFPSGDSNFVFRNVDLSWTANQIVNVTIAR